MFWQHWSTKANNSVQVSIGRYENHQSFINMSYNNQSLEQIQVPMDKIAQAPNLYFYHKIWGLMLN
jgi:hypothetical protein